MRVAVVLRLIVAASLLLGAARVSAADSIKIAFIDALSGPYAELGFAGLKQYQDAIAYANANGGALAIKLELVPLDDQSSVETALANLQLAIQQGIRYVTQGTNPEVTVALAQAIEAHNKQNPARSILFFDYGDGASQLDDEACSFWHFRFDASLDMKLRSLIDAIPSDGSFKALYLLNQDNDWGRQASREMLRALSELRPDLQIVADEIHPVGTVADFSGYVDKILHSGTHAVLTANRGVDLTRLMTAAAKATVMPPIFTVSNTVTEVPAVVGETGADRVAGVFTWHPNVKDSVLNAFAESYRDKHNTDWNGLPSYVAIQMLVTSIETSRSIDPLQVALVMEGLSFLGANGPVAMRDDNHQLLQPLFVGQLTKVDKEKVKHAAAGSTLGWKTVLRKEPDQTWLETKCQMQRPAEVKKR